MRLMNSLPAGYRAVVAGSTGGIGASVVAHLDNDPNCGEVISLSRGTDPAIDFADEATILRAAQSVSNDGEIHLFFCATGFLSDEETSPEKSLREIDPASMARLFCINSIGPALLMKHFCPLMSRRQRSIFAAVSARVGSISDNALGGWYSYRASKAALNMLIKGAAIELARNRDQSICVGLHPGTVDTGLSSPFVKGRKVQQPGQSAKAMLKVLDSLSPVNSGQLFAYDGSRIDW